MEANLVDYVMEEAEDPPEPIKTAAALFNERNPLHKLEERLDTKHMINHLNWGIYFTTDEFWNYETPFQHDIVKQEEYASLDYDDLEPLEYTPNLSDETEDEIAYSATIAVEEELPTTDIEAEEPNDVLDITESIISDMNLALKLESFIQKLIEAK